MRVSTDEQAISGYGLAFQNEKLRSFIFSQDYSFDEKHLYRDEGFSGTLPIEERPAMKALFVAAKAGEFDVVLVYRLDRFGRKILMILDGVQRLADLNVAFRSVTEPFDTSNAFGRYLLASLGALSELERETIKERTQGGRRMAAKAGKWIWGPPAYGYKLDPVTKHLKIVPEEAKWVKKFFEWIVKEKLSLTAVQKRVNELKIPCYSDNRKTRRTDKGLKGYWHKKSISRIFSNSIYTGTAYFYRFKKGLHGITSITDKNLQTDESQWVTFKTPIIVPQELFNDCRKQILINREMAGRNLKNEYLFNKLVYCGGCGRKLFAGHVLAKKELNHNEMKFYQGPRNPKWKKSPSSEKRCTSCSQFSESKLETIWEALEGVLRNPDYMMEKLRRSYEAPANDNGDKNKLIFAQKNLQTIGKKRQRLDKVYLESDSLKDDEYQKKLQELKKEESRTRKEILSLQPQQTTPGQDGVTLNESIKILYKKLEVKLDNITYTQKSEIIHSLVNKITLYRSENEAEVEVKIPSPKMVEIGGSETIGKSKTAYPSPIRVNDSQFSHVLGDERLY